MQPSSTSKRVRRLAPLGPVPRRAQRVGAYKSFVQNSEAFRVLGKLVQDCFVQRPADPLEHMALLLRTELARQQGMVPRGPAMRLPTAKLPRPDTARTSGLVNEIVRLKQDNHRLLIAADVGAGERIIGAPVGDLSFEAEQTEALRGKLSRCESMLAQANADIQNLRRKLKASEEREAYLTEEADAWRRRAEEERVPSWEGGVGRRDTPETDDEPVGSLPGNMARSEDVLALLEMRTAANHLEYNEEKAAESIQSVVRGKQGREKVKAKRSALEEEAIAEAEVMLREMDPKELADTLLQIFQEADTDKSGELDSEEFSRALLGSGLGLVEEDVAVLMKNVDTNKNGKIDFKEFCPLAYDMLTEVIGAEIASANAAAVEAGAL